MSDDFVHLHAHSGCSAFDGLGKPAEFVAKAAALGQRSLAISDHGSLRGLHEFAEAAAKAGIKAIPAIEAYYADDPEAQGLSKDEKKALKKQYPNPEEYKRVKSELTEARLDRNHITILAMNQKGLANLLKLNHLSWTKGFYQKARLGLDWLCEYNEGLAVTTGCPSGVICEPLLNQDFKEAIRRSEILAQTFGDRFLVELMPHGPVTPALAQQLQSISKRYGATLIATQDAHYPHQHDATSQEAMLCINTRSTINEPKFQFDSRDYWLKTRDELTQGFRTVTPWIDPKVYNAAMDNTVLFAERCSAVVEKHKAGELLAAPKLPPGMGSYDNWLFSLCMDGAVDRLGHRPGVGQYADRLRYELETIGRLGFSSYFVLAWEVRQWAREQGIFCGPGRGSAGGSLAAYLLRITDLDPIVHGLSFDRFMAPGRTDNPDIDADFESERRDEIIQHLRDEYGEDHVAHISTHTTLGGKATLKDLGRIYGIPHRDTEALGALIHVPLEEEDKLDDSLTLALRDTSVGRAYAQKYPDAAAVAGRLEGQLRSVGLHASGIVIATRPIHEIVPVETRKRGDHRILATAYDMHGVEAAGLVKLDVLGLSTLTWLKKGFASAGAVPEDVDYEDPAVLQAFTDGRFAEIFQHDTPAARRLLRAFVFRRFGDVAATIALNRPGPAKSGLSKLYIERAQGLADVKSVHPIYDEVMAETFGVPLYQEQVVELVKKLCGYSPEDADKFRKKVSKKLGLSDEEPKFIEGAMSIGGLSLQEAARLFNQFVGFASYGFNKSHSYTYAAIAVWSMWLKVHKPLDFYAAALSNDSDAQTQLRLAAEARTLGIPVRPPDVNHAVVRPAWVKQGVWNPGFQVRDGEVLGSIDSVKGIGQNTAAAIAEGAPYANLTDFYARTAGNKLRVTSATFAALAKADALRSLLNHQRFLVENAPLVWENLKRGLEPHLGADIPDYDDMTKVRIASEVWPLYTSVEGKSVFDEALEEVRSRLPQDVLTPGDEGLLNQGAHLIFARTAGLKLFAEDGGVKAGRAILTSSDGEELAVKIDGDVLETCADLLKKDGNLVLALCWATGQGGVSLEGAWRAQEAATDPVHAFLLDPRPTAPKDPRKALYRTMEDGTFEVEGLIVRVRRHVDRKGGKMLTCGLHGQKGYIRFMVFASRNIRNDAALIQRGKMMNLRLKRLQDVACCLSDREVWEI